jgi:Zn-dependent protease with chaperone function
MLHRLGLRHLEVRVRPATADHCLRLARRAWIVISAHTERQVDLLPFVLWHEVAHLARRDIRVRRVTAIVGFGLLMASLVSFDPRAMVIAWIGVPVVTVAGRWWSEAACDRLAVEHAGAHALHRWAADVRANRGARRVSRVRSFLSHPPLALRTALHP